MKTRTMILGLAVALAFVATGVRAQCCAKGDDSVAGKITAGGACPVTAALAKLDLTAEQKATIAAAAKERETTCGKAAKSGCSYKAGRGRKAAYAEYVKTVKAVLTAEQLQTFEAALPKKCATTRCGK